MLDLLFVNSGLLTYRLFDLIEYRHQLMHANSNRAGFLDLDGCLVFDLLPRYVLHETALSYSTETSKLTRSNPACSRLLAKNAQRHITRRG